MIGDREGAYNEYTDAVEYIFHVNTGIRRVLAGPICARIPTKHILVQIQYLSTHTHTHNTYREICRTVLEFTHTNIVYIHH